MLQIYSDLPQPVINALQEQMEFGITDEKSAQIKICSSALPQKPWRLTDILEVIKKQLGVIKTSNIDFDLTAKTASNNGLVVNLTEKEAEIIKLLAGSSAPVAREDLLKNIWQYAPDATTNTAETHIYRLRQKLTENFGFEVIDTIGGNYFIKND